MATLPAMSRTCNPPRLTAAAVSPNKPRSFGAGGAGGAAGGGAIELSRDSDCRTALGSRLSVSF